MQKTQNFLSNDNGSSYSSLDNIICDDLPFLNNNESGNKSRIISTGKLESVKKKPTKSPLDASPAFCQNPQKLFRLFVKKGEYVYARPDDIIMIESCDHLVKVYVGIGDKMKMTVRNNTLKEFISQLSQVQFLRICRFYAVNMNRISGGNFNDQVFEFDFKFYVKLKHGVSNSVFSSIGK